MTCINTVGEKAQIGSSCTADSDCINENAVCESGTCQCPTYYFLKDGKCGK